MIAIRYCERRGLISSSPSTSPFNNYKEYGEKVVQRLRVIKQAKVFGFSPNEIANLLSRMDIQQATAVCAKESHGDNCAIFSQE